eukprot:SAG31_NODE_926_length_10930_cov_135.691626_4_plen_92_part_00
MSSLQFSTLIRPAMRRAAPQHSGRNATHHVLQELAAALPHSQGDSSPHSHIAKKMCLPVLFSAFDIFGYHVRAGSTLPHQSASMQAKGNRN